MEVICNECGCRMDLDPTPPELEFEMVICSECFILGEVIEGLLIKIPDNKMCTLEDKYPTITVAVKRLIENTVTQRVINLIRRKPYN